MIEVKVAEHLIDKSYGSIPGGFEVAIVQWTLKTEVEEWLKDRIDRPVEIYLTGDEDGNWFNAINFKPEESTIAVEFKIRWS